MDQWEVLVPKLRVAELKMLLDFLHMKRSGTKKVLLNRIMSYLKRNRSSPSFEIIKSKITDLYLRTKQTLRVCQEEHVSHDEHCTTDDVALRHTCFDADSLPVLENRMFKTVTVLHTKNMRDLLLNTPQSKSRIFFKIPEECRPSLLRGSEFLEVQLKFFCWRVLSSDSTQETNKWADLVLYVTVNERPLENKLPLPHVVYITRYCRMEPDVTNEICFSTPQPSFLKNYTFSIAIVKRCLPERLISDEPPPFVDNTLEMVSRHIETSGSRSLELCLVCPFTKKPMKFPCRSNRCKHVDVFDLRVFLEDMQYFLNWRCPICFLPVTYETLRIDKTLKEHAEQKKVFLKYYKKRTTIKGEDADIKCEREIIVCD